MEWLISVFQVPLLLSCIPIIISLFPLFFPFFFLIYYQIFDEMA